MFCLLLILHLVKAKKQPEGAFGAPLLTARRPGKIIRRSDGFLFLSTSLLILDQTLTSLQEGFKFFSEHQKLWGFLYNLDKLPCDIGSRRTDLEAALTNKCPDINAVQLRDELQHLKYTVPVGEGKPFQVLNHIYKNELQASFPNLWIALRILLTIPGDRGKC